MKRNLGIGPGRANATPSRPYKLPHDLAPWVAQVLSNESWFSDKATTWEGAKPSIFWIAERKKRTRQLRKYLGDSNAEVERLGSCSPNNRCGLGACPECNTALQRFFVNQAASIAEAVPSETFVCSAVVEVVPYNALADVSLERGARALKRVLTKSHVNFALGGFDISLNIDGDGYIQPHWALQAWFITTDKSAENAIRKRFQPKHVLRPIKYFEFDGDRRGWAYALKANFDRRESYHHAKMRGGTTRFQSNTRHTPLQIPERNKLWTFLNHEGLAKRLIFSGVRPTTTACGIELVRLSNHRGSVKTDKRPV